MRNWETGRASPSRWDNGRYWRKARAGLPEAERLYRRVIDVCEEARVIVTESLVLFNLALLYEKQGRLDQTVLLLEQVVEIDKHLRLPDLEDDRRVLERMQGKQASGR